jgi:hypothetical protein
VSNSLAISAVTATLRDLLTQGIHADAELVDAEISTAPLDKTPKNEALPQVNLFLYGASPNTGWMNGDPPSARPGEESRPALALDLHYLVTVFGKADDDVVAHRLLGRTMRILHDHPVLGRDEIRDALDGNDLGDQVERVRITPQPLTLDEMSKLWTSFQREYRMSTAYHVSVVLIESDRPARTPVPVLMRGEGDTGVDVVPEPIPPYPALDRAEPPDDQEAARLDERVRFTGHHLEGASVVARLESLRIEEPVSLTAEAGGTPHEFSVRLPAGPAALPAGLYAATAFVAQAGGAERRTNDVPLAVAPELVTVTPSPAARTPAGDVALTVTCRPNVLPSQRASLLLGSREVPAEDHDTPTGTLTFVVRNAAPGDHWLRLRVDGVDSLLVDRTVTPPVFDPSQRLTIT